MDPTQALSDIRETLAEMDELGEIEPGSLAETVQGLDEWMTNGGFPPAQWKRRPGGQVLTTPGHVLDVPHGKRKSYDVGCHCLACRAANRLRRNLTPEEMKEYETHD